MNGWEYCLVLYTQSIIPLLQLRVQKAEQCQAACVRVLHVHAHTDFRPHFDIMSKFIFTPLYQLGVVDSNTVSTSP